MKQLMEKWRELCSVNNKDRQVLHLALPNIVANLSTPLLGLVDAAVTGHFADASGLAGVALGTAAFNLIYLVFIFLRKATTGLTAQALGRGDTDELRALAVRALGFGALLGSILLAFRIPLRFLVYTWLSAPDLATSAAADLYYNARILGGPAALANFGIQGWLLGLQCSSRVLVQQLVLNLSNIMLCIWLGLPLHGWGLDLGVWGVGLAAAIANYFALAFGLVQLASTASEWPGAWGLRGAFDRVELTRMLSLNGAIFLRSVCITSVMTSFNAAAAKFGTLVLAADGLLFQLQSVLSYGTDGFANAAEALVGEAVGNKDVQALREAVASSAKCGAWLSLVVSLVYGILGRHLLGMMTDIPEVLNVACQFLPWLVFAPQLSVWCYLLDGVFVGATLAAEMRDTMVASAAIYALAEVLFTGPLCMGNNGLWASLYIFMLARAVSLASVYNRVEQLAARQQDPTYSVLPG